MSESTFSYNGYELKITFEPNAVIAECASINYYYQLKNAGEAVNKFIELIDTEHKKLLTLEKILSYMQEVWEKQDLLEEYLTGLDYSFYTYTVSDSHGNCRYAVHSNYVEEFQRDKNSNFPEWAVVRIF